MKFQRSSEIPSTYLFHFVLCVCTKWCPQHWLSNTDYVWKTLRYWEYGVPNFLPKFNYFSKSKQAWPSQECAHFLSSIVNDKIVCIPKNVWKISFLLIFYQQELIGIPILYNFIHKVVWIFSKEISE